MTVRLRDPELCPKCWQRSRVVNSRTAPMSRKRRRACIVCRHRWNTFESLINPADITLKSA